MIVEPKILLIALAALNLLTLLLFAGLELRALLRGDTRAPARDDLGPYAVSPARAHPPHPPAATRSVAAGRPAPAGRPGAGRVRASQAAAPDDDAEASALLAELIRSVEREESRGVSRAARAAGASRARSGGGELLPRAAIPCRWTP